MKAQDLALNFLTGSRTISYKDYFRGEIEFEYLPVGFYNSESNALVIDNYPYGFNARTQIRYWVETTEYGDRFVSQTLNPKTNKWNAPKKSTYDDVMVLVANSEGHIRSFGLSMNDDKTKAEAFLNAFKEQLTQLQVRRIHKVAGWSEAMKHVTFSCEVQRFRHKTTGEVVTSVPMLQMSQYERIDGDGNVVDEEAKEAEKEDSMRKIRQMAAGYANISAAEARENETTN